MIMHRRFTLTALAIGALGVGAAVVGGIGDAGTFFRAYLTGYTFWLSLALGSLTLALLQFLTGGIWGLVTRRVFESAAATLPLMAVLFVPVLLGIPSLYTWSAPAAGTADALIEHKQIYLNVPFFVVRAVAYLLIWTGLAWLLIRSSRAEDAAPDPRVLRRLQRLSIVGLLVLALTASFAAIDWLMSLEPDWFSTMYPGMVAMGMLLLAFAFAVLVIGLLSNLAPLAEVVTPKVLNELGSLLLAFVMLWTYMAYFQYLLIWAGNLADEIPWYTRRLDGGWVWIALIVAAAGFAAPFVLLLFRGLKRKRATLIAIAAVLIGSRLIEVYWLVAPAFERGGPRLSWLYVAVAVGLGGLWLAVFGWRLAGQPLLPPNDPRLAPALEATRAAA
jgi:hypothetical protein